MNEMKIYNMIHTIIRLEKMAIQEFLMRMARHIYMQEINSKLMGE